MYTIYFYKNYPFMQGGEQFAGSVVSLTAAGSGSIKHFASSFDNITIQLIPIRPNNAGNVPIIHV